MGTPEKSSTDGESESGPRGKVAKVISKYDLNGIGSELESHWTAGTDDRLSLRALADLFNKELLSQSLDQNLTGTLDGEAANYYRLLTADDISSGTRIQAKNQLEQRGVNVEQLREDFVSRQAIHTYLTKVRDVTYNQPEPSDQERMDARIETIGRLRNRLAAVTEQTISEFAQSEELSEDDTRVMVLVQAQCDRCDAQYPIREYLTNDGCECQSPANSHSEPSRPS